MQKKTTEMPYQNANSHSLNWAPLVLLISPKMAAFPHQISQRSPFPAAPPATSILISSCFSQSGDLFFISRVRGQSPVIPVSETNLKQLCAL